MIRKIIHVSVETSIIGGPVNVNEFASWWLVYVKPETWDLFVIPNYFSSNECMYFKRFEYWVVWFYVEDRKIWAILTGKRRQLKDNFMFFLQKEFFFIFFF